MIVFESLKTHVLRELYYLSSIFLKRIESFYFNERRGRIFRGIFKHSFLVSYLSFNLLYFSWLEDIIKSVEVSQGEISSNIDIKVIKIDREDINLIEIGIEGSILA